ncbi:hypothetical protein MPSEU_001052200 [Mayamaea pseudoterrestris]|nr:hypothetical protein MPSEU_001052200 [Mayamaea pseudoterrestris]
MRNDANNNHSTATPSSHIEVCVRLRPLTVADESSSGFFKDQPPENSIPAPIRSGRTSLLAVPASMRKAHIPRPFKKLSTPIKKPESRQDPMIYAWDLVSDDTMVQSPKTDIILGRTHSYTLDRVYSPSVSNKQVYETSIRTLVHAAMDGYHTSVLAYGQTSTGKTFTMTGTPSNPGMIPLCVTECFNYLQAQVDPREYMLRVSYLEVYKEHIRDLLAATATPIRLFEANGELIIKGLEERIVTSPSEVFQVLAQGEARRQTGATNLNQHSSRSHTLVRIWIESKHANDKDKGVRISSLSLVDLAGSESVKLTGSTERQQEGHFINQSLMTLGKIVYQLSEIEESNGNGRRPHIPYRDSKLTRLLQPSLSGNARIALICCVSPLVSHIEESHNTFKFATRAKKIPQKATIQESLDEKTLLQSYKEEIEELKRQLQEAREQQSAVKSSSSSQQATSTASVTSLSDVDEDEIKELVQSIKTMERLILRSNPGAAAKSMYQRPEDLMDGSDADLEWDKEDDAGLMALLENTTISSPQRQTQSAAIETVNGAFRPDADLHNELRRVQGLLGSVLKKKREVHRTKSTDEDDEVRNLRYQLEQQAATANLSKADSSFLQQQLAEKDNLLHEVYKVLEQVEQRQTALETENLALKAELASVRNGHGSS